MGPYLPHVQPRKRSWKKDESLFRLRVRDRFGDVRLTDLKRQELQAWHADLLKFGIKAATADHHLKLVRQVLNMAVEWGVIDVNPIARIKLFNPDNRLENYLDPAELERLLKVLRTDDNRPVCNVALFLLSTGARLNEALVTWAYIDRENRVWRIPQRPARANEFGQCPWNDSAVEVLDQLGTEGRSEHLFVGRTGEHLGNVHKVWDRLRQAAGLPHLRLHDLRHQYASFLVNSGRTLYEVQKILGHSSHAVTERYAHLSLKVADGRGPTARR
ncbi:MAG: site-specific integrase [Rubrivivax sp.]|nr:site-specific integrase [Rubrivivax sp.]